MSAVVINMADRRPARVTGEKQDPLWVRWWPAKALDGMYDLTAMEELAYRRILDLIFKSDDNLRDDDSVMPNATKVGRRWCAVKDALITKGKITVVDGFIRNAKATLVCKDTREFRSQHSKAGKASQRSARRSRRTANLPSAMADAAATATDGAVCDLNPGKYMENKGSASTGVEVAVERTENTASAVPCSETGTSTARLGANNPLEMQETASTDVGTILTENIGKKTVPSEQTPASGLKEELGFPEKVDESKRLRDEAAEEFHTMLLQLAPAMDVTARCVMFGSLAKHYGGGVDGGMEAVYALRDIRTKCANGKILGYAGAKTDEAKTEIVRRYVWAIIKRQKSDDHRCSGRSALPINAPTASKTPRSAAGLLLHMMHDAEK